MALSPCYLACMLNLIIFHRIDKKETRKVRLLYITMHMCLIRGWKNYKICTAKMHRKTVTFTAIRKRIEFAEAYVATFAY